MRNLAIIVLFLVFSIEALATHNMAGEISYRKLAGAGFTYEITITTYTDVTSSADRCELTVNFGDGTSEDVARANGPANSQCPHMGETLTENNQVKRNIYIVEHTYSGPGIYTVSMEDPNRNEGVLNITNSVGTTFYIDATIIASSLIGTNNSPRLLNPPIDAGCYQIPYYHNPGAVDEDGDSLVFSLTVCKSDNGNTAQGFVLPDEIFPGPNNEFYIASDGTVFWTSPQAAGLYNFAIKIEEYRKDINGNPQKIGEVIRDMQVEIQNCSNQPPTIDFLTDVCVLAGSPVSKEVIAYDTDTPPDMVKLYAYGEPLGFTTNPATFNNVVTPVDTARSTFSWVPQCKDIRSQPFNILFKTIDNPSTFEQPLTFYESINIRVVGPEPLNPSATPEGNSIMVRWSAPNCANHTGFKVYRNIDSLGYVAPACVTGVPGQLGYELIATINNSTVFEYEDTNNGEGLVNGIQYCYMIVATYDEGKALGYPSVEVCAELKRDIPIITKVSVVETSNSNGIDSIQWAKPTELDQSIFPGPYKYQVLRGIGSNNPNEVVFEVTNASLQDLDTVYVDNLLNTQDTSYTYRIDFYSGTDFIGSSQNAMSVFLGSYATDNKLELSWREEVPWTNEWYVVYKQNAQGLFDILDTTFTTSYTDDSLANGIEQCYYIETHGRYTADGLDSNLVNYSQIHCNTPIDNVAPCAPYNTFIESDCEAGRNAIEWVNPNTICDEGNQDALEYNVYFTPVVGEPLQLIQNIKDLTETTLVFENLESVAGCYAVTTIDSAGNESEFSKAMCVDNCPIYELPKVFTPGNDGFNDVYVPFPYRHILSVDMHIFDRWGNEVYQTTNPSILWNGALEGTTDLCDDGVYFYVCSVFENRLLGPTERKLTGTITLISQPGYVPQILQK